MKIENDLAVLPSYDKEELSECKSSFPLPSLLPLSPPTTMSC